jgi:FkbM family methyltransferase
LLIHPADWSQTVIFDEIFVRHNYDLSKLPFGPSAVIDCGAHIGMFSLLAAANFPQAKVYAFEPDPSNADMIRLQVQANALRVELFEAAVSTEAGEGSFILGNSHSGRLSAIAGPNCRRIQVPLIDLPDFVARLKVARLLLKLDVEGAEEALVPILMPRLPNQCAVYFETHSGEAGWKSIATQFSANGFVVEQINSRGEFADGYACRA